MKIREHLPFLMNVCVMMENKNQIDNIKTNVTLIAHFQCNLCVSFLLLLSAFDFGNRYSLLCLLFCSWEIAISYLLS